MADYPMKRLTDFEMRNPEQIENFGGVENFRNNDLVEALRQAAMTKAEKIADQATNFTGKEIPFNSMPPMTLDEDNVRAHGGYDRDRLMQILPRKGYQSQETLPEIAARTQHAQQDLVAQSLMKDRDIKDTKGLLNYLAAAKGVSPSEETSIYPKGTMFDIVDPASNSKITAHGAYFPQRDKLITSEGAFGTTMHEANHAANAKKGIEGNMGAGDLLKLHPTFMDAGEYDTPSKAGRIYQGGHFDDQLNTSSTDWFQKLKQELDKEENNKKKEVLP